MCDIVMCSYTSPPPSPSPFFPPPPRPLSLSPCDVQGMTPLQRAVAAGEDEIAAFLKHEMAELGLPVIDVTPRAPPAVKALVGGSSASEIEDDMGMLGFIRLSVWNLACVSG